MRRATSLRERLATFDPFIWLATLAKEWWPFALNAFGVVGIGLLGIADNAGNIPLPLTAWTVQKAPVAWASALVYVLGFAGMVRRGKLVTKLEEQIAAATARAGTTENAVRALSRAELSLLATSFKHFSTERVSLFVPAADGFVLVARWSRNPAFLGETRQFYPRGQGCLWAAWESGFACEPQLPDPRTDLEGWLHAQEDVWKIPRATAESMTMRSRTYVAFRIDEEAPGRDPLGVVIFESQLVAGESATARLDPETLRLAIKGAEGHRLRVLLEQMARVVS